MLTAQDIYNIVIDLIDERLDNGEINTDDTKDYLARTPGILTTLQNEMLEYSEIYNTFEYSKIVVSPLNSSYDYYIHEGEVDNNFVASGTANAYTFEATGPGMVYIEEYTDAWYTLETIELEDLNSFKEYKGLINSSYNATNTRLRFGGSYHYNYTNLALYKEKYNSDEKIPSHRPFIKIEMPEDFDSIDQIIEEYFPEKYVKTVDYYWEGNSDMYVSNEFEGNIRIVYKPTIASITAMTDEISINPVTARSTLPYGLGARLMATENTTLGSYFQSIYDENKLLGSKKRLATDNQVEDLYDTSLSY